MNKRQLKLKNLISFGKQGDSKIFDATSTNDFITVRCQQSGVIDIDKDMSNLGLQVVNISTNKLSESIDLNIYCCINRQKFRIILASIKQSLRYLKEQLQNISNKQKQIINKQYFSQIQQEITAKIQTFKIKKTMTDQAVQTLFEESLLQNQSKVSKQGKLLLQSTVYSLRVKKQLNLSLVSSCLSKQHAKSQKSSDSAKQIKKLLQQNELKARQITLLKQQVEVIKNLSVKKQAYFDQKLKLKEIEWQRKINQLVTQWSNSNKHMNSQQDKQDQQKQNTIIIRKATQPLSSRQKNFKEFKLILPKRNFEQFLNDPNHKSAGLSRTYNHHTSSQNHLKAHFEESKSTQKKLLDKIRITRQRQRKQSTEYSFERVNQKIKNLQSSIRKDSNNLNI